MNILSLCSAIGHFWLSGVKQDALIEETAKVITRVFPQAQMTIDRTWGGQRATIEVDNDCKLVIDQNGPANLVALIAVDATQPGSIGPVCCEKKVGSALCEAVDTLGVSIRGSYGPCTGAATVWSGDLTRMDSARVKCFLAGILDELPEQLLKAA